MLSALYKHLYDLIFFRHNGQGLKTNKNFSFLLILLSFIISFIFYENITIGIISLNIISLMIIYAISNKDLINGVFLLIIFYLISSIIIPNLSWLFLIWIIIANIQMQRKYLK